MLAVVALVQRLEGIPLAIELAAARLRVSTIAEVVERLGGRFALLVSKGARTDRLATLEATFDWSWDLLDETEREALVQLTSFAGGFTLASAEAVLDVGEPAVDVVARLVDKGMLREVHDGRCGMSVTVQEYVERKGPEPRTAFVRHGQHFAELGSEEAIGSLNTRDGLRMRRAMGAELENLLRACDRAVAREDGAVAFGTWRAAFEVLALRGPLRIATALTLLKRIPDAERDSAEWHRLFALANYRLGQIEPALEHLQKAIRMEPGREEYYLDLAELLTQNNAREAVVAVLEAAHDTLPASVKIQAALGAAYLKMRVYDKAKETLQHLIQRRPDYEPAYSLLAECYDITNDWTNTALIGARLRSLFPQINSGWYYSAKAQYETRRQKGGGLQLAHTYLERALKLEPGDWRAHLLLAKLLIMEERLSEAIEPLRRAAALAAGSDPAIHYLLARTLQQLGREAESRVAFKAYRQARQEQSKNQRSLLVRIN
jgi:tetratricopeptide (TPR) repeat protein